MAFINITGELEITINGQSYGLTCPLNAFVGCCHINGTYYWYWQNGQVHECHPVFDYAKQIYVDGDCIGGSYEPEKVFCDPCANKCSKDSPGKLSYSGQYQWLFDMYVGGENVPKGIKLAEWTVTGGQDPTFSNGSDCTSSKLSVNGKSVCCSAIPEQSETVDFGIISKDVSELLKTQVQPYIIPGVSDPTEYCNCYCAGCGPNLNGSCGYDLSMIIGMMRQAESIKCS